MEARKKGFFIMETKKFNFVREGINCSGTGDFFDIADKEILNKYYFSWKNLNEVNTSFGMRRANLPEMLSEGLASMLFGWARTNASTINGCSSSSCDLVDLETGELIQLKGCSTAKNKPAGPTSFGPRSEFDKLVFMHLDCEEDTAYFYVLEAETYQDWKVNRNETIGDQQAQGRRPRTTILPKIKESGISPILTYHFD